MNTALIPLPPHIRSLTAEPAQLEHSPNTTQSPTPAAAADARRYNTKRCAQPGCGVVTSVLAVAVHEQISTHSNRTVYVTATGERLPEHPRDSYSIAIPCRGCGVTRKAVAVLGKFNGRVKCDARCAHARGHSCECQCGGKNHGAGHAVGGMSFRRYYRVSCGDTQIDVSRRQARAMLRAALRRIGPDASRIPVFASEQGARSYDLRDHGVLLHISVRYIPGAHPDRLGVLGTSDVAPVPRRAS